MVFKAKAENEIRQEVIDDLRGDNEDFDVEAHEDSIGRITERRLKDEKFKASVHKSKEEKKVKLSEYEKKYGDDKTTKVEKKEPKGDEISIREAALLQENKISTQDWDDVISYAKYKGISIEEALKSSVVISTLKEKQEERTSAETIETGKKRGGTPKILGQQLLDKAKKTGEIPESDEEIDALLEARYAKKD